MINEVPPNGSGAESVCFLVCTMGNGLLLGRDVEEQEEDAEAAASIMFVTTPLFQRATQWALHCKCSSFHLLLTVHP